MEGLANNRVNGWSYDAAGNNLNRGTYDAENRITAVSTLSFLYDGHSRRLRRIQDGIKTYYIYSLGGRLLTEDRWTDSKSKNYIYFGGQAIATHDQADYVRFIIKDHQGSTRSIVKVNPTFPGWGGPTTWTTVEAYEVWPYGEFAGSSYGDNFPQDERFTGKKRDSGPKLEYYGARYYDTQYRRWTSADPIMARPYVPKSLNKYCYTFADPINLKDPDGMDPEQGTEDGGTGDTGGMIHIGDGGSTTVTATLDPAPEYDLITPFDLVPPWWMLQELSWLNGPGSDSGSGGDTGYDASVVSGSGGALSSINIRARKVRLPGNEEHLSLEQNGRTTSAFLGGLTLVSRPNDPSDSTEHTRIVGILLPPPGVSPGDHFDRLGVIDGLYCNCLWYSPYPEDLRFGHNSNGYINGLITIGGGEVVGVDFGDYTGGNTRVPPEAFVGRGN